MSASSHHLHKCHTVLTVDRSTSQYVCLASFWERNYGIPLPLDARAGQSCRRTPLRGSATINWTVKNTKTIIQVSVVCRDQSHLVMRGPLKRLWKLCNCQQYCGSTAALKNKAEFTSSKTKSFTALNVVLLDKANHVSYTFIFKGPLWRGGPTSWLVISRKR